MTLDDELNISCLMAFCCVSETKGCMNGEECERKHIYTRGNENRVYLN